MEITVRNVNHGLAEALWNLKTMGVEEQSRNGPVIVFPEPVMTTYARPNERVLFWNKRDANPIFHLLEAIWMLAGRKDVKFPQLFNSTIGQFSDDGESFNAAYGYRWRHHFGFDQLVAVIETLTADRNTRQAVMQIWEPNDLRKSTKDKACNTQVFFEVRHDKLNMTVINRSNDIWWGCYGANAVHFSILHEFVAHAVGAELGVYRQFSHNLHLYTKLYDAKQYLIYPPVAEDYDLYMYGMKSKPIMDNGDWKSWLEEAEMFCADPYHPHAYTHDFFYHVAYPMAMVSKTRKDKLGDGMYWAQKIEAADWHTATVEWINRREAKKA